MFNYLSSIFGGKPITQGNTTTTLVDHSVKGLFKYSVRMTCAGYTEFNVIATTEDLNKGQSWRCPKCRSWMELPKLPKKEFYSIQNSTFNNHDTPFLRTCYGNGHSGSIKEVLEYMEN